MNSMYLQPNKLHQRAAIREKINLIKFEYIIVNALFVEKSKLLKFIYSLILWFVRARFR